MVDALVSDCNTHLNKMERDRQQLETAVASGSAEESLREQTVSLAKCLADYKEAAKHCKKHSAAPKPKAKSAPSPAAPAP